MGRCHSIARHRSIFGHYRGVSRRPGEDAGNITIYRLARGWVWMIDPVANGVTDDFAQLSRHEAGGTARGDAPRFQHQDALAVEPAFVE